MGDVVVGVGGEGAQDDPLLEGRLRGLQLVQGAQIQHHHFLGGGGGGRGVSWGEKLWDGNI